MVDYIGLDVSSAISIRRDGKPMWRGKCSSDPRIVAEIIHRRAPNVARVVFETGPLSVWFYRRTPAYGAPATCRAMTT